MTQIGSQYNDEILLLVVTVCLVVVEHASARCLRVSAMGFWYDPNVNVDLKAKEEAKRRTEYS